MKSKTIYDGKNPIQKITFDKVENRTSGNMYTLPSGFKLFLSNTKNIYVVTIKSFDDHLQRDINEIYGYAHLEKQNAEIILVVS